MKNTFEESIEELEDIVYKLESFELPLDETIEKYKYASKLIKHCEKLLSEAEASIKQIRADSSGERIIDFINEEDL